MARLIYRGIVHQKSEVPFRERLKRVEGLPLTYRGTDYNYQEVVEDKSVSV